MRTHCWLLSSCFDFSQPLCFMRKSLPRAQHWKQGKRGNRRWSENSVVFNTLYAISQWYLLEMCWQFFWFFWARSGCFARHVTFWTHWHKTKADVIFLMGTIHWMQCLVKICSNHVNSSDKMLQIPLKRYSLTWLSIKTFYLIHFLCRPYRRSVQSCSRICEAVSVSMLMVAG